MRRVDRRVAGSSPGPGWWCALGWLVAGAGCAAGLGVPPAGPGSPAPNAAAAWGTAAASCRGVRSFAPTLRLSGRIGDERVPGLITILGGLTDQGDIRLQASAPGSPVFVLAGTADRATLLLQREHRVLRAPAAEIVEALIGVRAGPADLLALLSGCVTDESTLVDAGRYGRAIWIATPDARVKVVPENGGWRIAGGTALGLLVEYTPRVDGPWPKTVRLESLPDGRARVKLTVTIDTFMSNTTIDPRAFEVSVPADATPMTIEELRAAGPLRQKGQS